MPTLASELDLPTLLMADGTQARRFGGRTDLPPDHWLHRTIRRAELMRPILPAALIATHRHAGFEHG